MNPAYQSDWRKLIKAITQKAEQDTGQTSLEELKHPANLITKWLQHTSYGMT